ncbi:FRG domain-containing protein [Enterovibrio norvegicus]|uniref:FRG domain-containing protein n=1 Tax=Enterovibrio norvegicus TaxID=188144 RepID=UPI000C85FFC1|nr:FRG domain-containing protein [Enterovibrio norvegicus]PML77798.1 FRG domain-containing protein [Enterovibrio norvegicus]
MKHINYIDSLSKFTAAIDNIKKQHKTVLYRGQPNIRSKLLPQAARSLTKSSDIEANMLAVINLYGRDYIDLENPTTCQLLVEAHNAGLETRLLDWSVDPYEALWYACHSPGSQPHVYMLIADDIPSLEIDENPFEIEQLYIMPVNPGSPYKNKRLTAHPSRLENGEPQFTALEDEEGLQSLLTELPIMPDLKDKIIYELNEIGINEHSIYNSLYGLCRHINLMYDNNQCSRITPEDADLPADASADGDLKQFKKKYVPDFDFD